MSTSTFLSEAERSMAVVRALGTCATNDERRLTLKRVLEQRFGVRGFGQHSFGSSTQDVYWNFWVDIGTGDRELVLIAHHDAVPGSPGANDNAAGIAILLGLIQSVAPPRGWRIRCLFPAEEETGLQGAQAYVDKFGTADTQGVLSLELCGIGDQIVVWDAVQETHFLRTVLRAMTGALFGEVPGFASDHRIFAEQGVPAYGMTLVPSSELEQLLTFVRRGGKGKRPVPFDTYHTPADAPESIQVPALALAMSALAKVISSL